MRPGIEGPAHTQRAHHIRNTVTHDTSTAYTVRVPTTRENELNEEFAEVSRRLPSDERDAFIVDIFVSLRSDLPEMVDDPWLAELLEASVTENVVSLVNFLKSALSIDDLNATSAALTHARALAQRDVPLASLIRAYRLGHALFLRMTLPIVFEYSSSHHSELSQLLVARSASFIDKVCREVGQAYEEERSQWFGSRGARQQYWVNEVLSGQSIDVVDAETNLGYRFSGVHVGVQMWLQHSDAGEESRPLLDQARRTITELVRPVGKPLVVPRDERELHAWFPVARDADIPIEAITRKLTTSSDSQVHLALGRPGTGLAGFRTTMTEAQRVRKLLLVSSEPAPVATSYRMLGPVALMTDDVQLLKQYVTHVLKDLAVSGKREATLRKTLRMFLSLNRSFAATAEEMNLHRNSVQYRVHQAMEQCGRDLNETDVTFELQAALSIVHWLGSPVLEDS